MNNLRTQTLGFHRNNKRLWINDGVICESGFKPKQCIDLVYGVGDDDVPSLKIIPSKNGDRAISDTHKGGVIDISNKDFTNQFLDYDKVQVISGENEITIVGHHHESAIKERELSVKRRVSTGQPLRKGGLFAGMGLLCSAVHKGLSSAGIAVKQRFSNEYDEAAAEANISGNEIWEDAFEDAKFVVDDIYTMDLSNVPKLDLLVMGSPCPAFSQVNTQHQVAGKKDIFHPDSGTIFQPILSVIKESNPAVVILENSKFFRDSIFDYIMSDVMERFGYKQTEVLINGRDYGDFEKRERLARVWYSRGLPALQLSNLPFQMTNERTLGSMLEPISNDDKRWGRRKYLEAKNAEKHNGHKYCVMPFSATELPTFGANYHKVQPDSTMISHPLDSSVTRIATPSEHCNIRGVDGSLKKQIVSIAEGRHYYNKRNTTCASAAHRMLGNSCAPKGWFSLSNRIGNWMRSFSGFKVSVSEKIDAISSLRDFPEKKKEVIENFVKGTNETQLSMF